MHTCLAMALGDSPAVRVHINRWMMGVGAGGRNELSHRTCLARMGAPLGKQMRALNGAEGAELPFGTAMHRVWDSGKLQFNKVFEYVRKATMQHMEGGGKLNKAPSSDKVAYRDLRRALGWPKGAPELT